MACDLPIVSVQDSAVPLMERLFSVGQLMPCCVQEVGGDRINLSVSPRLVNSHLSAKDIKPNLVGASTALVCVRVLQTNLLL